MANPVPEQIGLLRSVPPIEKRVHVLQDLLTKLNPDFKKDPAIPNALVEADWANDDPAQDEDFIRQIIRSHKDVHAAAWGQLLSTCTEHQARLLDRFAQGASLADVFEEFDFDSTRGSREEFQKLAQASKGVVAESRTHGFGAEIADGISKLVLHRHPALVKTQLFNDAHSRDPIELRVDAPFSNWGRTVENVPHYTYIPKTNHGVQQIVQYAAAEGLGVRVAGYRHSWSPIFARQKSILISTLDITRATTKLNTESLDGISSWIFGPKATELNAISEIGPDSKDPMKTLVRVGCATTNEQLRQWCVKNKKLTLPLNVIMVEITFGGSNAPICHGAGIKQQTLSDLVAAIEYVDAKGELQEITQNDGDLLKAASGCFGLIGVVTHITLKLNKMAYALLTPSKVAVIDAIPPPAHMRDRIPKPLYQPRTDEQIKQAQAQFERRASEDYYAEWFWFPYADEVWINTWSTTDDASGAEEFPSKFKIAKQWLEAVAMECAQDTASATGTAEILPMLRTSLISRIAMSSLQSGKIKTYLPDALHFRRAIQNTRVRDMELEIPLPPRSDDSTKPDFAVAQQAWWEAIIACYDPKNTKTCPMRMPLEMRIMGGSNVIMAPQKGNLATASIEVLTLQSMKDEWPAFAQDVLDQWMKLRTFDGKKLNIRPHWAKEWKDFTVDGKPFVKYLKEEAYKDEMPVFLKTLEAIGQKQGWTLNDVQRMFSNETLDELFFDH